VSFYLYRQNNTGGTFTGPAIIYIVEADSAEQANELALQDIYFDGKDLDEETGELVDVDCDCCGYRWERAEEGYYKYESIDDPEIINMEDHLEKYAQEDRVQLTLVVHSTPIEGITGIDVERTPLSEFVPPEEDE